MGGGYPPYPPPPPPPCIRPWFYTDRTPIYLQAFTWNKNPLRRIAFFINTMDKYIQLRSPQLREKLRSQGTRIVMREVVQYQTWQNIQRAIYFIFRAVLTCTIQFSTMPH